MGKFLVAWLSAALILLCELVRLNMPAEADFLKDDKEPPDSEKWMWIFSPLAFATIVIFLVILMYLKQPRIILHLFPVMFLILMLSLIQYFVQFISVNKEKTLRMACTYLLVGIMGFVALGTPFYASWMLNRGCCVQTEQEKRKIRKPQINIAMIQIQPQPRAEDPSVTKRLKLTKSPSDSFSVPDTCSPEGASNVSIHIAPSTSAPASLKNPSSPVRETSTSSSISFAPSPIRTGYNPLYTASTSSKEVVLDNPNVSSDTSSPVSGGGTIMTRAVIERAPHSEDEKF